MESDMKVLRRTALGAVIVGVVIVSCAWMLPRARRGLSGNAGAGSLSSQTFNFGQSRVGRSVEHIFQLRNEGAQSLKVTSQHADCSCTLVNKELHELPPGEVVDVPVQMHLGRAGPLVGASVLI